MVRTIYSNFSEQFWLDVAGILSERAGWEPVYWLGIDSMQPQVQDRFPNTIYHTTVDAVKGVLPSWYDPSLGILAGKVALRKLENQRSDALHRIDRLHERKAFDDPGIPLEIKNDRIDSAPRNIPHSGWAIDQALLGQLERAQLTAINMMDRMDALGSFSYAMRTRHFYRQVRYWSAVIEHLRPEVVVFKEIPHMVYDYILYELCRLKGIRTIMFQITNMRILWLMLDSLYGEHDGLRLYRKLLEDGVSPEDVPLSEHAEENILALQATYDEVPMFVRFVSKQDLHVSERSTLEKLTSPVEYPDFVRKQLDILRKKTTPPRNYLVQTGKTPEESDMSAWEYRKFRRDSRKKMAELVEYYEKISIQPDLERKFIYVPLTFQPEANSSPLGGVYADVELMVGLLSRSIPEDWLLYVKEHPSELHPDWAWRAQACRSKTFYDDIAAIPKVRFVPNGASSFDLIDHSKAVATLTGSSAWQSVNRGVPGMVFGYPWYRGCEGVFHIRTKEDCKAAIAQISKGVEIDPGKIRLFVHALEKTGVSAFVDELWRDYVPFDSDPQLMADSLSAFYQHKELGEQ